MLMEEIWKPVFEPYSAFYEVSNFGRIRNIRARRTSHKPGMMSFGERSGGQGKLYLVVKLSVNGSARVFPVSNVVARAFVGDQPSGTIVDHINDNTLNNRSDNLQYLTHVENLVKGLLRKNESVNLDKIVEEYVSRRRTKTGITE